MRALGVIKFYISSSTSHELALGVILDPIDILPLHGGKEGLGYSIVMRTAGLRERLDNLVHAKQFPECVGCILWALVAVKHEAGRFASECKSLPKCLGY